MYLVAFKGIHMSQEELDSKTFGSAHSANNYIQRNRKRYPNVKSWRIIPPHEAERFAKSQGDSTNE